MWAIYSLDPAPWGQIHRLVEQFENERDAETVLAVLESVNISFHTYEIVYWKI